MLDIEDLVGEGDKHTACPFFAAKAMVEAADILLMPYNYITDKNIRDQYAKYISNGVLIVDEAHNIEKAGEEGTSFDLSLHDLQAAHDEMDAMKKKLIYSNQANPSGICANEAIWLLHCLHKLIELYKYSHTIFEVTN